MRPKRYKRQFAVAQTVADMKRQFVFPDTDTKPRAVQPSGGGGAPTVVVAASDASDLSKSKADFVCTGVNDEDTIQAAINTLTEAPGGGAGGRVLLTEGIYRIGTNNVISTGTNQFVIIEGFGFATRIESADSTGDIIQLGQECTLRNVHLVGTGVSGPIGVGGTSGNVSNVTIDGVTFQQLSVGVDVDGDNWAIQHCRESQSVLRVIRGQNGKVGCRVSSNNFGRGGGLDMADMTDWVISGNTLRGSVLFDGTGGSVGERLVIVGNQWHNATVFTNAVIEGTGGPAHIVIVGNQIECLNNWGIQLTDALSGVVVGNDLDQPFRGIELIGCSNLIIGHNYIHEPSQHGIILDDSSASLVEANHVFGAGQAMDDTYDGIHLTGDSDESFIHGNDILGSPVSPQPRYAVNVSAATCECNRVVGNNGDGQYGSGNINDAGTGTILTWPNDPTDGDNIFGCTSPGSP